MIPFYEMIIKFSFKQLFYVFQTSLQQLTLSVKTSPSEKQFFHISCNHVTVNIKYEAAVRIKRFSVIMVCD